MLINSAPMFAINFLVPLFGSRAKSNFMYLTVEKECMLNVAVRTAVLSRAIADEAGSCLGASSFFIASALRSWSKRSLRYFVGICLHDAMREGSMDAFIAFKANARGNADVIGSLRGNSRDITKSIAESIDFLFIAGVHSYDGVRAEEDAWFPELKLEAIEAFHEIGWAAGVQRVVSEDVLLRVAKSESLPRVFWATVR